MHTLQSRLAPFAVFRAESALRILARDCAILLDVCGFDNVWIGGAVREFGRRTIETQEPPPIGE